MSLKRKPPEANVRRVRSNGQNLRYTITNKAGQIVQCESHQERKLALLLERDTQVMDYRSQPEILSWYDDQGKAHSYVPDFQVWRQDGRVELHEVTLTQRREKSGARQEAAMSICRARGWAYIVHTESTLPDETEWQNLLAVYPYRAESYRIEQQALAVLKWLQSDSMSWADLQKGCTRQDLPALYSTTLHLLWHGYLSTNWKTSLFMNGSLRPQVDLRSEVRHARQDP
jgi:hypothetical protein